MITRLVKLKGCRLAKRGTRGAPAGDEVEEGPLVSQKSCTQLSPFIFLRVEVYTKNKQFYSSNKLHAIKLCYLNTFLVAIVEWNELWLCETYEKEEVPDMSRRTRVRAHSPVE